MTTHVGWRFVYSNREEERDLKRHDEGFVFLHAVIVLIDDVTSP